MEEQLYIVKGGFFVSYELKDQYDKIYKYCYFKVKNSQVAEDLTQETFLKFFSQHSYINRGKQLAYLYTIAKNLYIDTYKNPEILSLDDDLILDTPFENFETGFIVRQAILTLSDELQEIVFLRFVNDLSIMEISSIIGISRFRVYRRLNNALKELKLILREEDFIE